MHAETDIYPDLHRCSANTDTHETQYSWRTVHAFTVKSTSINKAATNLDQCIPEFFLAYLYIKDRESNIVKRPSKSKTGEREKLFPSS